ncbi:MAG: GNAT family N-acetyltransferase [Pseudomonadota bacterium]
MRTRVIECIDEIPAADWNRVAGMANPFLRHEFLAALEHHDCVGARYGWVPQHITLHDEHNTLIGAAPLYLKDNSYGEFVFDWSWADAWHRAGKRYYPKLVSAIPYTPVTGPRLLVAPDADNSAAHTALIEQALSLVETTGSSTLHWLFTDAADTNTLFEHKLLRRTSCHFHWHNPGYRSFDDFLSRLTSRKRKKIKRERRYVTDAGIRMEMIYGDEATDEQWHIMYEFYRSTFERKSGIPTLSLQFFREISQTMGRQVILVFAWHAGKAVAGAINLCGDHALYGRHWGCREQFHSLHFETCYYQGIDYCIRNGLRLFEPGAQGEHKISRGFLPSLTWSAHWIADPEFRAAVEKFLLNEHELVLDYRDELQRYSPFRKDIDQQAGEYLKSVDGGG